MTLLQAPAKINLRLRVLAREEGTGYHQIETVFCRLQLADELRIEPAPRFELTVEGADLGDPRDNLVTRAARAFAAATGIEPALHVRVTKHIPAAAGLGGGSSDAAAMLLALNRMHGAPLAAGALHQLGAQLGADVPFFLGGAPLAFGWGRGERLLALPTPPPATVLIIWPGTQVPTAAAYAALTPGEPAAIAEPLSLDDLASWERIAARAVNDFESVVWRWVPGFAGLRDALREAGARIALLAGSGSAVFGLFDAPPAEDVARSLRTRFPASLVIATRTAVETARGVDPVVSGD